VVVVLLFVVMFGVAALLGISPVSGAPAASPAGGILAIGLAGAVVEVLATMFMATVTTVLYFDQRQRQGEAVTL
jgi:hypothetical protein